MEKVVNNELIKGLEDNLVRDMFRAVTDKKTGMVSLNPVSMINVTFVRFGGNDKIYIFENPSDKRLKQGSKVCVKTLKGLNDAYVVTSFKVQKKYLKNVMTLIGAEHSKLKKLYGVYEYTPRVIRKEELVQFGEVEQNDKFTI